MKWQALVLWLDDGVDHPSLMEQADLYFQKLRHSVALQATRWGRLRCWLSSGAENLINWVTTLPRRRTEGHSHVAQNDSRDRGVMAAWFGTATVVNAKYQRTQTTGTASCALDGCPHGRTRKPTKLGPAPPRMVSDKESQNAT